MKEKSDKRELEHRIDLLEERMNTHEARLDATLNAMRTDIERGQNSQTKWIIGVGIALAALIIGGVGILIAMQ